MWQILTQNIGGIFPIMTQRKLSRGRVHRVPPASAPMIMGLPASKSFWWSSLFWHIPLQWRADVQKDTMDVHELIFFYLIQLINCQTKLNPSHVLRYTIKRATQRNQYISGSRDIKIRLCRGNCYVNFCTAIGKSDDDDYYLTCILLTYSTQPVSTPNVFCYSDVLGLRAVSFFQEDQAT